MIRINLLPIRQARKRESVKQQLVLAVVILIGAAVGIYLWYNSMASKVEERKRQIKTTQQQIEQYKKAIGEVEKYKGLEDTLNRKLKIIESLIKGKTGPVKVLDRLSQVVPKQVWLLKWAETNGLVTLEGEALNNKYVAQFVTTLKESGQPAAAVGGGAGTEKQQAHGQYFTNIRLVEVVSGQDEKFVEFKIIMNVNYAI